MPIQRSLSKHSTRFSGLSVRKCAWLAAIFGLLLSFSANGQVPAEINLESLLRPPEFPLLTAKAPRGSLQERLQRISRDVMEICRTPRSQASEALACQWPRVVQDLDATMTALAETSPDPKRLTLTLAARLHPAGFLLPAKLFNQDIPVDALFARYLMAHRLVRDLLPSVENLLRQNKRFEEPMDRLVDPWLTTSTPWSFSLRAMRRFVCLDAYDCKQKRIWGEILEKSMILVQEDETLDQQLKISPEDFMLSFLAEDERERFLGQETKAADLLVHDLLLGVFEGLSPNYLFFSPGTSAPETLLKQVREYFTHVAEDSRLIFESFSPPVMQACGAFELISRTAPHLIFGARCLPQQDRAQIAAPLEAQGSLLRYQFLQARMTLAFASRANRNLSPSYISARQRERALRDILQARGEIQVLKLPKEKQLSPDLARKAARPLVLFLYDMIDGTETP